MESRTDGPMFTVKTWREARDPHGLLWFARVVRVRPECAPWTATPDEARAVVEGRACLTEAVRAAVARFVTLHGRGTRS